jgi:hypothetical protein
MVLFVDYKNSIKSVCALYRLGWIRSIHLSTICCLKARCMINTGTVKT